MEAPRFGDRLSSLAAGMDYQNHGGSVFGVIPLAGVALLDAEFRARNGSTVVVEVDGAVLLVQTYWDDMDRQNSLTFAASAS